MTTLQLFSAKGKQLREATKALIKKKDPQTPKKAPLSTYSLQMPTLTVVGDYEMRENEEVRDGERERSRGGRRLYPDLTHAGAGKGKSKRSRQAKDSEERRRDEGVDGLPWKVREQLRKSEVSPQEEEYSSEDESVTPTEGSKKMLNRDLGKATCLIKRFEETANQLKAKLDG